MQRKYLVVLILVALASAPIATADTAASELTGRVGQFLGDVSRALRSVANAAIAVVFPAPAKDRVASAEESQSSPPIAADSPSSPVSQIGCEVDPWGCR